MSRIFPVLLVSFLVNFFLFFMMTQILSGKKLSPKEHVNFQGIERIDFKTKEKAPKKIKSEKSERPALPEAPPPLKVTVLSPALQPKRKQDKPEIEQLKPVILPPEPIAVKEHPKALPIPIPLPMEKAIAPELPPEKNTIPALIPMQKALATTEHQEAELIEIPQSPVKILEILPIKPSQQMTEWALEQVHEIEQNRSSSEGLQIPEEIESSTEVPLTDDFQEDTIEIDILPLLRTQPRYPRRAIRAKLEGMVTIAFTIQTDGSVSEPVVVTSAPPNIFDRAALRAIRLWKFRPKQINGKRLTRRAIQNIRFSLKSRKH